MVEWKELGKVCNSLKKETIKQGDLKENGFIPVINSGVSLYGYYDKYNNDENAFTFASRGEYAGYLTYINSKFWAGGLCYPYRSKDEASYLTKYIYEYLKSREKHIMGTLVMRGGIPALNKVDVDKIQIPIPSKPEQERIVKILDNFTDSIANLKAQIDARRKQYEYYRNQLLDLEEKEGVEMKTLGEVCEIGDGIHGTPIYNDLGNYYFINGNNLINGRIIIKSDTKKVDESMIHKYGIDFNKETIFMSINGTIGNIAYYNDEKILLGKSAAYFIVKNKRIITAPFLYHFLQSDYAINYYNNSLTGSTIKNLGLKALRIFPIPIPSKEEQSRIVGILDQFEAIIANLEAQLKAREKQYEYYRNKLLTFE